MSDPNGSEPASHGGRAAVLWGGVLVPAVAATAVLVFGDSARLLRLGLVAALWATLIAALAVVRLRSRLAERDERLSERQRRYELELEREIAARREFELEVENETRRRVEEETDGEMESLRAELRRLREMLEGLVGGDMLYERVALHTESTRVRSLAEPEASGNGREHAGALRAHDASGQVLAGVPGANKGVHPFPVAPEPPGAGAAPRQEIAQPAAHQATHPQPGGARPPHPQPSPPHPPPSGPRPGGAGGTPPTSPPRSDVPGPPSPQPPVREHPAEAEPSPAAQQEREPAGSGWTSEVANGAHAEGTSVVDLLATYGSARGSGRRRRRSG